MQKFYSRAFGMDAVCTNPKTKGFYLKNSSQEFLNKFQNHVKGFLFFLLTLLANPADLISQTCTCTGTNLVQNHSFESGTNNWNWSGGTLSAGSYAAQCGSNAGHFQISNTSNNWVSQQIGTVGSNGISVGSIITVKVYGGTHNPSYYHRVGISYFTSNWTYISGDYTEVNAQLPNMIEYTVSGTVPPNTHYINVEKGGNGDWVKTDRWCASVSQCNPDNSSAPPFCAPQPVCPSGNNFAWSQSINSSDGSPSTVRLICSSKLTYTIPGSYPSAFNGPVNVNVSDVVSWDGYSGRGSVTQQNERWRIIFKKNGSTVHTTPYTNDVPDLKTQGYWRGSLGTTAYLPNGADQIILEHWAVANDANCSNSANSVVPVSVCIGYTPVTCSNVTNGGQIGSSQTSCMATFDPAAFTNISSPSGGSGALEYLWLKSTTTCVAPNGSNNSEWESISDSNSSTLDIGPIHQNTCYIRCSRRAGCTNYDGESNVISVTVSGPAVQIGSALTLVKDRNISNEVHCSNSTQRVLWLDCLLENSPGGSSGNRKYWKIISGGAFKEYCDGTAYFEMRVQNLVTSSYELDIKVVLSGRTYSTPSGSPHIEGCTSSASSDWYYYQNMTGTITGVNGLAGALLSIDRKGASFQIGTNASLYASSGQFGASAWFIYNVMSHPSTFKLGGECGADLNFLLSGGALTSGQSTNCGSICRGASTQLTANGAGGKPGYTYSWDNSLGTGQTKSVSPINTTTYKVTITDTNGCTSTSQTTINVNPQPVLNAGQDVAICSGQSVLLTVNATNGTPPYTYNWPNPPGGTGSSKSVSPTTATTYVVTVTDSKGCTATDDVRVTIGSTPSVSVQTLPVCAGATLSVTSTPSGGTPGYTYSWSGPGGFTATSQNITRNNSTVAMSGTYSVTMTDSQGCSAAVASTTATVRPAPVVSLGPDKSICNGDEYDIHSEVTGIPTCGTPGTMRCDNPISNSDGYISNLSTAAICGDNAGAKLWTQGGDGTSYITLDMGASRPVGTQICVRVKLEHCSQTSSTNSDMKIRRSESSNSGFADIVASKTFSHNTYQTYCYTLTSTARYVRVQDNGKCSFRLDYVEFSTPDTYNNSVTYAWNGPGIIGSTTGTSITVNQNGTYVLVVTDCGGCTASDDIVININNNVVATVDDKEICLGGSATLTANAVVGATYEWTEQGSNTIISTAQSITVSPTTTKVYIVTIRKNGCEDSDDATVVVNPNPIIIANAPEVCAGSTLAINSTPSGGTPGYSYSWTGPGGYSATLQNPSRNSATTAMSGIYNVTVTDSKGCKANTSTQGTVNPNPAVSVNAPEVCAGSTLAINSTPSGGSPGYSFNWTGPGGFTSNVQNISRGNATVGMSGLYNVTVTDNKGCKANTSTQATVNPNLSVSASAPEVCAGFTLNINALPNSGTPGYNYNWTGPGGFSASSQNLIRPNATVAMSGLYSVTVTDSKGCVGNTSVNATVNPNPTITASAQTTCEGQTLNVSSSPNSGTPGYSYIWSGPGGFSSTNQNVSRPNATVAMSGTYSVTVTDIKGCVSNTSVDVTILAGPTSGISGPQTTCAKESVLFTASPPAGVGSMYSWTFQGGTPANGTGSSVTSQWNSVGTYNIQMVVTKNGCTAQYNSTIVITEEVFSIAGPDKNICQGGLTTINGQGPVGGNFSWTVVSGDPTSIDSGSNTADLSVSPLFTTVYKLTVSQNGCVRTDEVTVFVNVSLNPIADAGNPMNICGDVATIIGGNPTGTPPPGAPNSNLGYIWSPATGLNSTSVANPTLTLSNPGTYEYQVIVIALISGCTDTATVSHTIVPRPTITANAPEVCAGFTLYISSTPSSGTPGFSYNWSGPGGFSASTQNVSRPNSTLAMSGLYSVTVTDSKGCVSNTSVQATVNPNPSITANAPEVCAGFTLNISSTPSSGTPGYSYNWSGPGGFSASTQNVSRPNSTVAMSGLYSVTVTDSKGCVSNTSVQATVNPNPSITANAPEVCAGFTLIISSTPSSGTPGFSYNWSGPGGFSASTQNVSRPNSTLAMSGLYSVTVTDSKGCVSNTSVQATVLSKPVSGISGPETTCAKEPALFIVSPPAGPGSVYSWTFQGGTPANATGSSATSQWDIPGEYLITMVVTKNGCEATYYSSIVITQEVFSVAGPDKEICQGGNVTINGQGPAGANFAWTVVAGDGTSIDNGAAAMNILVSPLYTTTYKLTVSQNGCVRTDEVTVFVNVNLNPIANAGNPLEICKDVMTVIGGNPTGTPPPASPNTPLGYIWSPATGLNNITLANPTLTLSTPGTYTYEVIVIALTTGCTDTATVTHVVQPKAKVGDFVWEDLNGNGRQDLGEPGINGVQVTLHNSSNNAVISSTSTTNKGGAPGYYEFEVCKGSYYIIFGDVPSFVRTTKNAVGTTNTNDSDPNANTGRTDNFTLNPGDNNQTIDAGYYKPASIGDFVWEDKNVDGVQDIINEPGISGVIVRLLDEGGNQLTFTVTSSTGYYLFSNLKPGNYRVKFDTKAGYFPTGQDLGGNDATDSDANPTSGLSHLISLVSGQTDLTIDAGYYRLARIGDTVWEDTTPNNIQDPFEPGIPNVTVTLTGTKGTDGSAVNLVTSTNGLGKYDFSNLTPGSYTVNFTRPSSIYLSVVADAGIDDTVDSDAHVVTGQTGSYLLLSGEYNNTIDAGFYRCSKVGDLVWIDLGPVSNVQDGGDIGINGVEVRLYKVPGNVLIETQFTRNSPIDGSLGYYLFECVAPGTYYIKVIKPTPTGSVSRYDFVQPNQGGNDMLDSDIVDFLQGNTLNFTVGYAQTILDIDIGLISVLPVNIKELNGWWNKKLDVNELHWTTTQEVNNSHFLIERSLNKGRFENIGKVVGNGTSASIASYSFTDQDINTNGEYIYRLRQVDFDGKENEVGQVFIGVYREGTFSVNVYPNPTKESATIDIQTTTYAEVSLEVFDAAGKLVYQSNKVYADVNGSHKFNFDMTSLTQGVYYSKIQVGNEHIVKRIIKVE
ncbi:MAG: SdrD B-like domain-containing protein [Saprospiraceae bacterium]